ncbi:MAG: hypothetical protein GXY99_05300 [Clostridiaceae bacterium]|jgi:uridine kinase|nr:hypothetical protein [Clostridiaceae bacterium]HZJ90640.1 uridine kinase [Oscillospiraceae bacterium]
MKKQDWYQELKSEISRLENSDRELIIIAIDGSSASGKTSLSADLAAEYDAQLFHIDDFFLTAEQRTPERLAAVGEFFDKERLLAEVLEPLKAGRPVLFRRFNCATQAFSQEETAEKKRIVIIEGVYSLHPDLRPYYDLKLFLYVDRAEQIRRLKERSPEKLELYLNEWLPREEAYFEKYDLPEETRLLA